jgi:hypothetical protein
MNTSEDKQMIKRLNNPRKSIISCPDSVAVQHPALSNLKSQFRYREAVTRVQLPVRALGS